MLKVISTSVLFGLLGSTLPAFAEESRYSLNRTVTDDRKAYAKPHASSQASKHIRHNSHYPVTAYYQQNPYVQYAHPHDSRHYQTVFQRQPRLKRHHVLPKHLAYSRVSRQVENRLGHLPAHLMRVRIGDDISAIHIKSHIKHEIIRGLIW